MPLKPEFNPHYWPLLLTEELYLLPEDVQAFRQQAQYGVAQNEQQASNTTAAQPAAEKTAELKPSATQQPTAAKEQPATPAPDLVWGSLNKGILILVNYPQHPLIDRPDGLFLVDVLKAVGFDFKEVATLNIHRCTTEADWSYVRGLNCRHILSFGVQVAQLPATQRGVLYQQVQDKEQTVLLAESLSHIRTEVASKKKLWNLLKEAFV